jgi:hypothetical protein
MSHGGPKDRWGARPRRWAAALAVAAAFATPACTGPGPGFPDAANTGVPAGVALEPWTASCDIRADDVVIDGRLVDCGGMLVYGRNLTIRNSVVRGPIMTNAERASVTVADSNIEAGRTSWAAVGGGNLVVQRSELTGGQHSVQCASHCVVEDSFLHDQWNDPGAAFHNNAFISNGGTDMVVRRNTLWCSPVDNGRGGGCTADLSLFGDFSPVTDVAVAGNRFHSTAGGYCGTFGHNPAKPYGSAPARIMVTGNVFERGSGRCGSYGPATSFLAGAGSSWSGNTWEDGSDVQP